VFIQVNTSGEKSKHGADPASCVALAEHLLSACPRLEFSGLMTIGRVSPTPQSDDFVTLRNCRDDIAHKFNVKAESLELSMGMSADYELAVECGATSVRLGSSLFGARDAKAAKDEPPTELPPAAVKSGVASSSTSSTSITSSSMSSSSSNTNSDSSSRTSTAVPSAVS